MGLIKDFKDFRSIQKQTGSNFMDDLRSKIGNRWSDPPVKNTEAWLQQFETNPRLNPVAKIATTISMLEYEYSNEKDEISESLIIDFFTNPRTMFTFSQLLFLTSAWLRIVGECGWIVERGLGGIPKEAYPIPPHWILEIPTYNKPFYTVRLSEDSASFYNVIEEDFVYFRNPKLVNPYTRGYGQTMAIGDEIETDEYMAKYSKRFFFNDATPPLLITAAGANSKDRERLRQEWKNKYQGGINAYEPAFFTSDIKVDILKQTQKEMDFVESRRYVRNSTIEHFGIPKEIFGITENSNRSTIDVAEYIYMKYVVKPDAVYIQSVINSQLLPNFKIKGYFEFVNLVPEDEERKAKNVNDGLDRGSVLIDEWREAHGMEPLPNGEGQVRFQRMAMTEKRVGEEPEDMDSTIEFDPEEPAEEEVLEFEEESKKFNKGLSQDFIINFWKQLDSTSIKIANKAAKMLKAYFRAQELAILDTIGNSEPKTLKEAYDNPEVEPEEVIVASLLDWDKEEKKLLAGLYPYWMESEQHGFEITEDMYSFGIVWDLEVRPEAVASINKWGATKVKGITETTQKELRELIRQSLVDGDSVPVLQAKIKTLFDQYKSSRATSIARTEVHNAMNDGVFQSYGVAGVEKKQWITTIDGRERKSHENMNGETSALDSPFSNGLMFPGDPNSDNASEVIQCRCTFVAVLEV